MSLNTIIKNKFRIKPEIELSSAIYLYDDKVLRATIDGKPIETVDVMINLMPGLAYFPSQSLNFSFVSGPCLINDKIFFGIKPILTFYFSQKWAGKISYINVFKRVLEEDFESISFSIGRNLY